MNTNSIKTQAEVIAFSEDQALALLRVDQNGCGSCSVKTSCLFKTLCHSKNFSTPVPDSLELKVGDTLELAVNESHFFRMLFVAYMVPLLGIFLGIGVEALLPMSMQTGGEVSLLAMAAFGLLIGVLIARMMAKRMSAEKFEPKIVRIISRFKKV